MTETSEEREEAYKTRPRSWSQLSQYEQCPQSFYLERIAKVWQRPAAWFATGIGVHSAVEAIEKGEAPTLVDALRVAEEAFRADVNARMSDTPNASYWAASGPYKGPEDITRRYKDLGRHLENYVQVAETLPPVHTLDGVPMVEHKIDLDLDGVRVIGAIDQVRSGLPYDVKAGSMTPKEPGQLRVYAEAIRQETGLRVTEGVYLMTAKNPTSTGKVSKAQVVRKDLTTISLETLTARFHAANDGIRAENWEPKPSDSCNRCSVLGSCPTGQKYLRGVIK